MSWRDYSLPAGSKRRAIYCIVVNKSERRPVARAFGRNRSLVVNHATSQQQAGLEEHQSSVKPSSLLRVLPESTQRAKLQGSAHSNFFGEATRGFR